MQPKIVLNSVKNKSTYPKKGMRNYEKEWVFKKIPSTVSRSRDDHGRFIRDNLCGNGGNGETKECGYGGGNRKSAEGIYL